MSGFTPRPFGDEPTGLQDVLAFIADFEMEDNVSSTNRNTNEWMDEEVSATGQRTSGKVYDAHLEDLFVDGGRQPAAAVVKTSSSFNQTHLLPTNTLGLSSPSLHAGESDNSVVKTTRRHRVSRKEELEYLRTKVIEMENKLKTLKDNTVCGQSPSPAPVPLTVKSEKATMQLEQSVALWKKMAERQKSQRELVESENAKLREKLKTQVRMAKSLQRVLRKRERAAEQITSETPKRCKHLLLDANKAGRPGEFDQLVASLGELYALTNESMSFCPVASETQPMLQKQDVKHNDLNGMFIEFARSKLVPFDLEAVNRAIWRHTAEPGIKFNTYFEEFTETRDNMILRKFGVEIKQEERVAKMSGRQAIRQYLEGDQIVIVRSSVVDRVELSGAAAGGLTFRDVGWIVIKDVTGHASASSPMTMVSSYSTLTPDVDLDSQWEIGALTDFVCQSREDIEIGNESILENLLLEEAAKRKSVT